MTYISAFISSRVLISNVVSIIVEKVKKIDDYETLKLHPEIILLVCTLIEEYIPDNKYKIDKKELGVIVLDKLFTINDVEREEVRTNIQFIYDKGGIPIATKTCKCFFRLFKK